MGSGDRLCGIAALFLAGITIAGSYRLPLFRAGVPGTGFLPSLFALFIAVCGLLLLLHPAVGRGEKPVWPQGPVRWQIAGSYVALFGYFMLIPILGFLLMTGIFLTLLMWWWGGQGRWVPFLFGGIGACLMYLAFRVLLEVPLPLGIWGE
jgi:putative tricarboxylic transport membrane protein